MAIKKNELYSSLWASCDKLRGGMDASQYKDYILTLLFVKYVTDKFKGVKYADITVPEGGSFDDLVALKGNKNIGEEVEIGKDTVVALQPAGFELRSGFRRLSLDVPVACQGGLSHYTRRGAAQIAAHSGARRMQACALP